jgi:hypothetical protein
MAKTGGVSGTVTVSEGNISPTITQSVNITTPTITDQSSGQVELAAGGEQVLNFFSVLSKAVLVSLSFTDKSTGDKKDVDITDIGGTAIAAGVLKCTDFVYSTQDTATGIASMKATTAAGNVTLCDFVIAGV